MKFLYFSSFKKYKLQAYSFLFVVFVFLFLMTPFVSYRIGMLFFGKFPQLYNVSLAHFFLQQAAYPRIFGDTHYSAHYQLARINFIQGDLVNAIKEARKELLLHPDNYRALYILALTYGYSGQEEEAIKIFATYLEKVPDSWAARNDKAWLHFRIGDVDGALVTLEPIAFSTGNVWVQNSYGVMLLNKGRYSEALVAFEHANRIVDSMSKEQWGYAYPGNDPRIYDAGLEGMKQSIKSNLFLVKEKLGVHKS